MKSGCRDIFIISDENHDIKAACQTLCETVGHAYACYIKDYFLLIYPSLLRQTINFFSGQSFQVAYVSFRQRHILYNHSVSKKLLLVAGIKYLGVVTFRRYILQQQVILHFDCSVERKIFKFCGMYRSNMVII